LANAKMHHISGLTETELEAFKAKGAIIDEDSTINASNQLLQLPRHREAMTPSLIDI